MRPPHCVLMCLCVCVFVCVNVCVCVLVGSWGTPIFLVPLGLVNSRRVGSCANCVFDYMLMPACMGTVNAAEILLRRQIQEALEALARIGAATLLFDDHSSVSHQSYALLECRDKCVVQLLVSRTQTCLRFQTSRSARALLHTHTHIHTYTPTVWMEREKRHAHMQTHSVTDTHHTRGAKSTGCSNRRSHPLHSALHCLVFSVVSLCWLLHVRDQVSVLWHDSSACHCDEYLPIFATLGMGRLLSSLASFVFFFSPSSSSSSSSSSLSLSFGTARFSFADAQPTRLLCCRACLWHIQCAGGVREHCARHP